MYGIAVMPKVGSNNNILHTIVFKYGRPFMWIYQRKILFDAAAKCLDEKWIQIIRCLPCKTMQYRGIKWKKGEHWTSKVTPIENLHKGLKI